MAIERNAIRCNRCGLELVSEHRHDFKTCPCDPPVAVDGGLVYLRRLGDPGHYTDLSEHTAARPLGG